MKWSREHAADNGALIDSSTAVRLGRAKLLGPIALFKKEHLFPAGWGLIVLGLGLLALGPRPSVEFILGGAVLLVGVAVGAMSIPSSMKRLSDLPRNTDQRRIKSGPLLGGLALGLSLAGLVAAMVLTKGGMARAFALAVLTSILLLCLMGVVHVVKRRAKN